MRNKTALAIAARATQAVGLLAISWLATKRITAAELGFFFSFLSFGSLVQLADFGLSYASMQAGGNLAGTNRLKELRGFARRAAIWNLWATLISTTVVFFLGALVLRTAPAVSPSEWSGPWGAYMAATFLFQLSMPGIALREGSGRVAEAWKLRLVQEWVGTGLCILILSLGGALWCLAAYAGGRAAVAGISLMAQPALPGPRNTPAVSMNRWLSDIWPFQWKIGLSSLSGFFIFRAFSPIILMEKGPVLAGRFGLAISIMNLLIAVTSAWPMSHAPHYSTLLARGQGLDLRSEFSVMLWRSTVFSLLVAFSASIALWWARGRHITFALSLTDPPTTLVILAAAVAHHIVMCLAMFLRAQGKEPFMIPTVAGSVIMAIAIWLAARFGTPMTIAEVNLFFACLGIAIALFFFNKMQRQLSLLARATPTHESQ